MIALIQRVTEARVTVDNAITGEIGRGLLALVAVQPDDTGHQVTRMVERILTYRVFPDEQGKMNLSLQAINGELLLVPQFTLVADTGKGLRPSFSDAAPPELGKQLFEYLLGYAKEHYALVESGVFGADMQVSLNNDGPVTFWLQT